MNEKQLIECYFKDICIDKSVQVGIGDDAAIVNSTSNHQLVVSTDSMVIDRHFLSTSDPYHIGYKLMAVNISDMAAMGAVPKWVTLNLTLPVIDEMWLKEFAKGFGTCAKQSQVALIGGDLTGGKELNISAQILGEVPVDKALLRSGADINDQVYVTGKIGTAGYALAALNKHKGDHSQLSALQMKALYQPESRTALSLQLREFANAAIDVSDGLLHDLELLCDASQVDAQLHIDQVPVDDDVEILDAITSGDDYELIFTVPEMFIDDIDKLAHTFACPLTPIGKIIPGKGHVKLYCGEEEIPAPNDTGFDHFMQTT